MIEDLPISMKMLRRKAGRLAANARPKEILSSRRASMRRDQSTRTIPRR